MHELARAGPGPGTPPTIFADISQTAAQSDAFCGTPVYAPFLHMFGLFKTQVAHGQVTRSRRYLTS